MLDKILAISGKPGLYRLVARGNNNLIVESLADGRRMTVFFLWVISQCTLSMAKCLSILSLPRLRL